MSKRKRKPVAADASELREAYSRLELMYENPYGKWDLSENDTRDIGIVLGDIEALRAALGRIVAKLDNDDSGTDDIINAIEAARPLVKP